MWLMNPAVTGSLEQAPQAMEGSVAGSPVIVTDCLLRFFFLICHWRNAEKKLIKQVLLV